MRNISASSWFKVCCKRAESISMGAPFVVIGRVEAPLHHEGGLPPISSEVV